MRRTQRLAAGAAWLIGALLAVPTRANGPAKEPPPGRPPWQRMLRGDEARKAAELAKQFARLREAGKFEDALKAAEALAELRAKAQGKDHWQAASARWEAEAIRRVMRRGGSAREDYSAGLALARQADMLVGKGRYRDAQPLLERALAILRKALGEDHPRTARVYHNLAYSLAAQARHAEAEGGYRRALATFRKALGEGHPETASCYANLANSLRAQRKYAEAEGGYRRALATFRKALGERHPITARAYSILAANLVAQGRHAVAEVGYRRALAIWRRALGEGHPETAAAYRDLASNLSAQDKHAKATEFYRKALASWREAVGEGHPDTASAYNALAVNLEDQGKYNEAAGFYRKALAIWRKALGEEHPDTAAGYGNLASNLRAQGKYAEAAELNRKALTIFRRALGEGHPDTAASYSNLAANQAMQGRYAEAEEGLRKALAIRLQALGEEHPDTARSYNNLASVQFQQARYAEAEGGYRKALAIKRRALGEGHTDTALSYSGLAASLNEQGKYAEAEDLFRKTLVIWRKTLGEDHPDMASSYSGLAASLNEQGRYAEAEPLARKALAISRHALGEDHPNTAASFNGLAANLNAQGKYAEAESFWLRGADRFAKARLRIASSGLDRAAITGEKTPLAHLAAVLARNGKPGEAWRCFEEGLARGTWDDLSARLRRPPDEQDRQAQLAARLDRLDQLIEKALAVKEPTTEQERHRKDLLGQRHKAQDELDAFARRLEKDYGPAAGQVFDRERIQAALPADAALVGWLDVPGAPKAADPNGEHWAVLLRSSGPPAWVRLPGSGPKGAWVEADTRLPADLRAAVQTPRGGWRPLARQLRAQRLGPLAKHLATAAGLPAVRRLIVLPSTTLAGVPAEIFAGGYTVSYALSGTLYAHLRKQPRPTSNGLLALADPVFDPPVAADRPPPLPPGGALLTLVPPRSNAALAGLRPNDVLLRYHETDLQGPADLKPLPESTDPDKRVAVTVWREGRTFQRQLRPGKLGVLLAKEPAPRALAQQRRLDRRLAAATRGGDDKWEQLPGTRAEAEALRRLFGGEPRPLLLADSEASEQRLYEFARTKELGKYRYLHLATHGAVDDRFPLRSALILSRDRLPDPQKQLDANLPLFDGRLTAEEVLRYWRLDSDLVTLSACQTALGTYAPGEGHMGFAQALILAGSRSVCLSQWKVDDAATALLMDRFYRNLLGKRDGLRGSMGKAEALREAKQWLRTLPRAEALKGAAALTKGVQRGKGRKTLPLLPAVPGGGGPGAVQEEHPYAHPYYWAAFVLIGSPD